MSLLVSDRFASIPPGPFVPRVDSHEDVEVLL